MTPSLLTAGRELRALLDTTRQAQGLARTIHEARLHRAVADITDMIEQREARAEWPVREA